jgi:hypothetical protein
MFCWPCISVLSFVNNQLDAQFIFMYVYFYFLHVSGSHVPIIMRINCINTSGTGVQLKSDRILIWVIYLLKFTLCYITQLNFICSKCWKWCPFISMHLSTPVTMFLATFLSILSFHSSMSRVIFIFKILIFSKKLCLKWA